MWSNEAERPLSVESWIASAGVMPSANDFLRNRVLDQAYQAQSESRSTHHLELGSAALLMLALLAGLPEYYHSLRTPLTPSQTVSASLPTAVAGRSHLHDEIWSLVDSTIAARDHSARALRGAL
jgi:hypothetical protein